MPRRTYSLIQHALVIMLVIVVPLVAATIAAIYIGNLPLSVLVFVNTQILLVIIIPFLALQSESIQPQKWLESYLDILSRLPILGWIIRRPNRLLMMGNLPQVLSLMGQRRIQVEVWKQLHKECQQISLKLIVLRGVSSADDLNTVLHDLETLWRVDCSWSIQRFVELDYVPEGIVLQQIRADQNIRKQIDRLSSMAKTMDDIVDECHVVEVLRSRLHDLRRTLYDLDLASAQLLKYLDDRIQRSIGELNQDIESARATILPTEGVLEYEQG